jgi:hypothetical protein
MNTKLILALAALVAVSGAASAYTYNYSRDVFGPTTADITFVGQFGVAVCDASATVAVIDCSTSGIGAIVDVSNIASTDFVSGTCDVSTNNGANTHGVVAGTFSYSCGTDRDDDGFVTNVDLSCVPPGLPGTCSSDPVDGFDDDSTANTIVSNTAGSGTAAVCFRSDNGEFVPADAHTWDDFAVFIAINVPSAPVDAGSFHVSIGVSAIASCTAGGHTHATWY